MQLTRRHTQRLRQMLRSAGWPMLDVLEAELLTAGLLQRVPGSAGAETLRVTDAGLAAIAASAVSNRAALSAHEALVQRVATELARAGRIVWRGAGRNTARRSSASHCMTPHSGGTSSGLAMARPFASRPSTYQQAPPICR